MSAQVMARASGPREVCTFSDLPRGACYTSFQDSRPYVKWTVRRDWCAIALRKDGERYVVSDPKKPKFIFPGPGHQCRPLGIVVNDVRELGLAV